MNRLGTLALALAASAFAALAAAPASAQSSGNFTYGHAANHNGSCSLALNGAITGGEQCVTNCTINALGVSSCTPQSGTCMGHAVAGIKTNSGSGNVFDVVVSAVIGLLTDVTVSNKEQAVNGVVSSSALAGANFQVTALDPSGNPVNNIIPSYPITFDSRFVEISTNLFQAIVGTCTPIGVVPNPLGCFLTFDESTVSAHTYQFLIPELTTGVYTITTTWKDTTAGTGISEALVCVSDVVETVQQNKVFHFNTVN